MRAALLGTLLLLGACATPQPLERARAQLRGGDADAALATLAEADVPRRDRLLLHLDRGLAAHAAGRYRDSIAALAEADALIDTLDRISVSEQGAALLVNDRATSYRGESAERLWIHTFQMLNFLALGEPEGAAVEARRALSRLDEHPDALAADPVTRLLIAMSFEAAGQAESAGVEYRRLVASDEAPTGVLRAAWLNARRTARPDEAAALATRLPGATLADARAQIDGADGELVVVFASGFVPPKVAGELFVAPDLRLSFPRYAERWEAGPPTLEARLDGRPLELNVVSTTLVEVARAALAERGTRIATRQAARTATKYNLARAASREDALAGEILRWLFFLLEQADTRGWETLPATLSLAQIRLPPGRHDVELAVRGGGRSLSATLADVTVRARRRTFRSVRPEIGTMLHYAARPD